MGVRWSRLASTGRHTRVVHVVRGSKARTNTDASLLQNESAPLVPLHCGSDGSGEPPPSSRMLVRKSDPPPPPPRRYAASMLPSPPNSLWADERGDVELLSLCDWPCVVASSSEPARPVSAVMPETAAQNNAFSDESDSFGGSASGPGAPLLPLALLPPACLLPP